jgi:hypothetical protein
LFLTLDELLNMQEKRLRDFVARKIPEATGFIDYKQAIFKGSSRDDEYREFLKDVTGFANSQGGHILYGVCDPSSTRDGVDPVVGVENGVADAKAFENVAANSIDPRLSGFRVIPISIENGRHVLIAHIPPDGMRPHRVNHNQTKTWNFYIRHGESIRMMTTQEIRDSVLSSATSEQRAIAYSVEMTDEFRDEFIWTAPVFFVQAVPLVPLERMWDVTSKEFRQVMFGNDRKYANGTSITFHTNFQRSPTLRGVRALDERVDPKTIYEIHRNGWIGAVIKDFPKASDQPRELYISHADIFLAFADLCDEALAVGETESPYLLRAQICNLMDIRLDTGNDRFSRLSEPYKKHIIRFPDLKRQNSQPFREAVHPWRQMFVNAFGLELPDE